MAKNSNAPIIIKKVKKGGHDAPHGGAWKVAYADFVTAMMAFFLLLWLLNVTTDIQKRGIADYFQPTIASKSQSGAGGILGGMTVGQPGAQQTSSVEPSLTLSQPMLRQLNDSDDDDQENAAGRDDVSDNGGGAGRDRNRDGQRPKLSEAELERQVAEREDRRFAAAEFALHQAVEQLPDLKGLAENLIVDRTLEGLRIQLVDQDKSSMFALGSADPDDNARKLIAVVSQVVQRLPNKISITGHTDAVSYMVGRKYSNWELSSDRANASRREFVADGVPPERIDRVVGLADRDLLVPSDPTSPRNRRISIVLLRSAKDGAAEAPPAKK
jgi:chemotaxis protein MotB